MSGADDVRAHYRREGLLDAILEGLRALGKDPDALVPADLAAVDHFHLGGIEETRTLVRHAELTRDARVLDVGGGIGGAARILAREVGCRVTVLDLAPEYCRAAEDLTRRTGLADRVDVRQGSALEMPFADATFDAAWTQHSSMNVEDKERLYREIRRVLVPEGRLALHEVTAGPVSPIHYPVPWARGPRISFLRAAPDLRALVAAAGFREVVWADRTAWTLAWLEDRVERMRAAKTLPALGLHLLVGPDLPVMFANMLRNLAERRMEVIQGVWTRGGTTV